jgi:hypothetical protein
MEYRRIRYTIRAGIERDRWLPVIHPRGAELTAKKRFDTPQQAESYAHDMINRWLGSKIKGKEPGWS